MAERAHSGYSNFNRQGENMEGGFNDCFRRGRGRHINQSGTYGNDQHGSHRSYRGQGFSSQGHSHYGDNNCNEQMGNWNEFQNQGRGQGRMRERHDRSWDRNRDKQEGSGMRQHSQRGQHLYGQTQYNQWEQNQMDWGQQRNYYRRDDDPDKHLSKTLSFLLRHGAQKQGFTLMPGGFLYIDDILRKVRSLDGYTTEDVIRVVDTNDKQRFAVQKDENGRMKIRANQGHTLEVEDLELTPVTTAEECAEVIHGTYYNSWEIIKEKGLSRMGRNHIHFAVGEPGENGVISGMRSTCQVMIFIDLEKALKDGLKFFISANNVVLSPGDKDGIIYPTYFKHVLQRSPRALMAFDNTICKGSEGYNAKLSKSSKKKKKKKRAREEEDEHAKQKERKQKSSFDPNDSNHNMDIEEGVGDLFNEDEKDDADVKSDNNKMDTADQRAAVKMEETPDDWEDAQDYGMSPASDNQDVVLEGGALMAFDNTICKGSEGYNAKLSKSSKKKKKKKRAREEEDEHAKQKERKQKSSFDPNDSNHNMDIEEGVGDLFNEDEKDDADVKSDNNKMDTADQRAAVKMEETPDDWEDAQDYGMSPASDNQDVVLEGEYDILHIKDTDASVSAVDNMMESKLPIAVSCYGENLGRSSGIIKKIVCATDKVMTVFWVDKTNEDIVGEGTLRELLTAREPLKIFHACAAASLNLFEQFKILLDGAELFDTKVAYETVSTGPDMLEKQRKLNEVGFRPREWEEELVDDFTESNQDEEAEKTKSLLETHKLLAGWLGDNVKKIKKDMYEEANSLIDKEKLNLAKADAKKAREEKKKKQKAMENAEKQIPQQKSKKKKGK